MDTLGVDLTSGPAQTPPSADLPLLPRYLQASQKMFASRDRSLHLVLCVSRQAPALAAPAQACKCCHGRPNGLAP